MKNVFVWLGLFVFFSASIMAQTVDNPIFKARGSSVQDIVRIERTQEFTRVYIHATFRPHQWIKISASTYLEDVRTGNKYHLLNTEGIEVDKETYMPESGKMNYTLIFEPIPSTVQCVHYIESPGSNWNIYYISLMPHADKRVTLLEHIRGNWYAADESNQWICGVFDSVVIINNRIYTNREIRKKRKQIELLLQVENEEKQSLLCFKPKKNGDYEIGFDGRNMQICTQQKTRVSDFSKNMGGMHPFFRKNTSVVQGYIKGYDPLIGFTTGMVYLSNELTQEDYPTVIKVESDGRFSVKLPLIHPIEATLVFQHRFVPFYIEPGDTLSMYIDWEDILDGDRTGYNNWKMKHAEYMGNTSSICYLLNDFNSCMSYGYGDIENAIETLTPEQYASLMKTKQTQWIHLADSVIETHQLPEKLVRMLRNKVMLEVGGDMFDFIMYRDFSIEQDTVNPVLKAPVKETYYNFVKEMPLNDETLLADVRFDNFLNRLEYMRPLSDILTEENKVMLQTFRTWSEKGILTQEKADSLHAVCEQNIKCREAAFLKQLFGNEIPFCWEITYLHDYSFDLKYSSSNEEVEYYTSEAREKLSNKVLLDEMERLYEEAMSGQSTYQLPEGKATDVFRNIIDKYKGKVVFVDFWATTCGPCRSGIENTADLRKKYKDHPEFQFVYITSEGESPEKDYNKYVEENLNGEECYRLSAADFHYLRQLFRFNGIPHYELVEKDGSISRKHIEAYTLGEYLKNRFEKVEK